jgi:hypothetical protein
MLKATRPIGPRLYVAHDKCVGSCDTRRVDDYVSAATRLRADLDQILSIPLLEQDAATGDQDQDDDCDDCDGGESVPENVTSLDCAARRKDGSRASNGCH